MTRRNIELEELGLRLLMVDRILVQELAARRDLTLRVGSAKIRQGVSIYRGDIEEKRLAAAMAYGESFGLNPHYVAAVMYATMREACMTQLSQRETPEEHVLAESYVDLKANLRELTKHIAPTYDEQYQRPGTRHYLRYEDRAFENLVEKIPRDERGLLVDLGCGTGNVALRAAGLFESVIGYDLSPEMLDKAREKKDVRYWNKDVTFVERDVEDGIPLADNSASFVTMTLGTGSDVKNLEFVIAETLRVLKPGGHFLFSFYNKDALLYQWQYVPWQVGMAARFNLDDDCLDVAAAGKIFQVFGRPYSVDKMRGYFAGAGNLTITTYPTISSILPSEAFMEGQSEAQLARLEDTVAALDRQLSFGHHGAYIIATGEKQ